MSLKNRKILHLDLDAFFCSVEEILNPDLKGKPFATGGSPSGRGVVTSCSYAARKLGIRSAMPMSKAIRIAPSLLTVRSNFTYYSAYSRRVMDILESFTPLVEQISVDEAFLDISDMREDALTIARRIQKSILDDTALPCSIGIAQNMLIAKMATNFSKSTHQGDGAPSAILRIKKGEESDFLDMLPIRELWGIGKKSEIKFKQNGYKTIGQLARAPIKILKQQFGDFAETLQKRAKGIDSREIGGDRIGIKSVSNERTFSKDIDNEEELLKSLHNLCAKVGYRLRKKHLSGHTIRLKIRWTNFETHTRQVSLSEPTNHDSIIYKHAKDLLFNIWKQRKAIRLIGVGVANLTTPFAQLSFFEKGNIKEEELLKVMDEIRNRYGKNILKRGWKKDSKY